MALDRTRWRCGGRWLGMLALCVPFGGMGAAHALGLGEIVQQSSLGEPLRLVIPVLVNADDSAGSELSPECFKLTTESPRATELPQVPFGRATLERSERGLQVVVTTTRAVNDPIISVTVQAGCNVSLRREYAVLLDPPVIAEPVAEAAPAPAPAMTAPPPGAAAAAAAAPAATANSGVRRSPPRAGARAAAGSTSRPVRRGPAAAARSETKTVKAPAAAKDSAKPQLRVSQGIGEQAARTAMSDVAKAPSEREITQAVEAETVVLQRRVAELSATLERMQAELRETRNALELAQRTAKASVATGPDSSLWLLAVALLLMVVLLAVMLARMRRSQPVFAAGPPTVIEPDALEPAPRDAAPARAAQLAPVPGGRPTGAHEAPPPATADPEASFEEDLIRTAAKFSELSVLEREYPKLLARLLRDWGKPKVIADLREILVSPRVGAGALSRDAVSELMLLQGIAMETAGYRPDDDPWRVPISD